MVSSSNLHKTAQNEIQNTCYLRCNDKLNKKLFLRQQCIILFKFTCVLHVGLFDEHVTIVFSTN